MDCDERFEEILGQLTTGATRFNADAARDRVEAAIAVFESKCSTLRARYLRLMAGQALGGMSRSDATLMAKGLLRESSADYRVRFGTLRVIAKLTLDAEDSSENTKYRRWGLRLARQHGEIRDELTVLANWIFALVMKRQVEPARIRLREAQETLTRVPLGEWDTPYFKEIRARLLSHEAKVCLAEIKLKPERALLGWEAGVRLYRDAIETYKENDHVRVNLEIEAADQLGYHAEDNVQRLALAKSFLDAARRGLDAHACEYCPPYFDETEKRLIDALQRTGFEVTKAVEFKPKILGLEVNFGYLMKYLARRFKRKPDDTDE